MLTLVLHAYVQELLDEARKGEITQTAVINETKLLLGIRREATLRRALDAIGFNGDLIPMDAYQDPGLTKVCRFIDSLGGIFSP
jgi:hypothetical protein